jgi:gluconokinase
MPKVSGLRSPYAQVGRIVYFGRMLDKIRLHSRGMLPAEYRSNLGEAAAGLFDARCCRFLGVTYADVKERVLRGESDDEILAWAHAVGTPRSDDDCLVWNHFMMKRGWRDDGRTRLEERVRESGELSGRLIETMFDYIDYDEDRDPVAARSWELRPPLVVLIMGVAGTGKTTVGQALASAIGWSFRDADDFHPPSNIAKMAAGRPLDDSDRDPWLASIRVHITATIARGESAVVTCSALKESYRRLIIGRSRSVKLVHLHGDPVLIRQRIAARKGHFMKPAMLDSQLADLEPPRDALLLDISNSTAELVSKIRTHYAL